MPPPKKPKTGPTSLEQFLSEDEIQGLKPQARTTSESSDVDMDEEMPDEKMPEQAELPHEEGYKNGDRHDYQINLSRERVFKSSTGESISPSLSPSASDSPASSDANLDVEVQDHMLPPVKETLTTESTPPPPVSSLVGALIQSNSYNRGFNHGEFPANKKVINSLMAASSFTFAHTLSTQAAPSLTSYLPPYLNRHALPVSPMLLSNSENEPHDLSLRTQNSLPPGLIDHRFLQNFHLSRLDSPQHFFPRSSFSNSPATEDKDYLNSHKNVVGILLDQQHQKHNIETARLTQLAEQEYRQSSSPLVTVNGLDSQLARESVNKLCVKEEQGVVSPNTFLPMHMMLPSNQAPTSTTPEAGEQEIPHLAAVASQMMPHASLTSHMFPSSEIQKIKQEPAQGGSPSKVCQVCNDNASGFHYGVWSCEGCKAFFKRSIQGPVDYVCPATNTCTIDKHRRKSCQACRLRKCYEVGMNKGTQRKERKSNGLAVKTPKRRADSSDTAVNSTNGSPQPAKNARRARSAAIVYALTKTDLPLLESYHNHSLPPTRVHLLNSLTKLAERELVYLINWAKNVPGYTDLTLSDQVHLIECCWMELLLLNCIFRSTEQEGRRLAFAPDLILERPHWNTMGMTEILEQAAAVSEQMVQYNLQREELLLLQATVLVNAEVRRLASYSKIYEMRQDILDALVDQGHRYHPESSRHIPGILLLLTHVRQAGERAITYFQKLKSEGAVMFSDLLKEMLDAQSFEEHKPCVDPD